MQKIEGKAVFFERNEQGIFTDVVIRDDSLSFDLIHSGNNYTVSLHRRDGSLYKGKAIEKLSREEIPLTARVFQDGETGLTIISGTEWVEKGTDYMWFVEIAAN